VKPTERSGSLRIKVFSTENGDIENAVNKWLASNDYEIVDINHNIGLTNTDKIVSIMITYIKR